MINKNFNGLDIRVYDENLVYLDDWIRGVGYKTKDKLINDMVAAGSDEDDIDEAWTMITDEFADFCEESELIGMDY